MSDPVVRLAARGDGVTASGRFVTGAVPGDTIDSSGCIAPGPHRQTPPCRHFGRCGGCQLQHIDDHVYADFVKDRIVSALAAQGVEAPELEPPHLSPPRTRRRVALKALKSGKTVALGFSEAGSNRLVDLRECPVMADTLFAVIAPLRLLLGRLMRDRRAAEIRMTIADQGIDLSISGVEADGLSAAEVITAFASDHRLARLSLDEGFGMQPRWEPQPVSITMSGVPVPLPEGAFLQATADGEAALIAAVRRALDGVSSVADLFAGLGTFSFGLDAKVHAVEGARDALLSLQLAAKRSGRAVSAEHRDLFRRPLTASELSQFDAVLLDPPRAGAKEQVAELAASTVPYIAYVSCNPATFARDAKVLVDGGYRLTHIQPVGQFRWSTHVELAARFSRQ